MIVRLEWWPRQGHGRGPYVRALEGRNSARTYLVRYEPDKRTNEVTACLCRYEWDGTCGCTVARMQGAFLKEWRVMVAGRESSLLISVPFGSMVGSLARSQAEVPDCIPGSVDDALNAGCGHVNHLINDFFDRLS